MSETTVEIKVKHIFEELCFNLAQSLVWGTGTQMTQEVIDEHRNNFKMQTTGIVALFQGTSLLPIGNPQYMYCGIYLPSAWIDYINANNCWPEWFDKSKIVDSRFKDTYEILSS